MNDSPHQEQQHADDQAGPAGLSDLNAATDFGLRAAAAEHENQAQWSSPAPGIAPVSPPEAAKSSKARRRSSTEDEYRYRVSLLWRQATDALTTDPQQPPIIRPLDVVDYLIERSKHLRATTWGLYRSALLFEFGARAATDTNYAEAFAKLGKTRESSGPRRRKEPGGHPESSPRRATRTAKAGLPKNDLTQLLDQLGLQNRTTGWGARAQYWLLATLATGVRPNEWEQASWGDANQTWLLAPNSKRKIDVPAFRRQAAEQAIPVSDLGADAVADEREEEGDDSSVAAESPAKTFRAIPVNSDSRVFVDLHLSSLNGSGLPFLVYYNNCRTAIWAACKRIWKGKKTYSLYSARHQYSANSKAAYQIGDVAELMGQTDEKSPMHYAPRRLAYQGAGGIRPTHADGQVESAGDGQRAEAARAVELNLLGAQVS